MDGFHNLVLHVDVSERTFEEERIDDSVYQGSLGGKGLGAHLLLKYNKAGVDPLSRDNIIIFATGPATDTKVWGSVKFGAFTKSPLTGIFSESYASGRVSEPLSRTGYDAIIIKGASNQPVYLEISNKKVLFHDAKHLWGRETYESEDAIRQELENRDAGIIVIGPAGENLVRFALIENNYWRSLGRTGPGAVLGSKKIKGVAFYGDIKRQVARSDVLNSLWEELKTTCRDHPSAGSYKNFGTLSMVPLANEAGAFPTKYWTRGTYEKWENLTIDALRARANVHSKACPRCFLACAKFAEIREGRHKGLKIEGPEYETVGTFGGLCLIDDITEIAYLNDICDRLGMDTISAGNVVAFAIEAAKVMDIGEEIDYGDVDAIATLLYKIARREKVGDILANGVRRAAGEWGLEDLAVHVKGLEPPAYEPRALKGMGLTFATSDRGACHMRSNVMKAELSGVIAPEQIEGKAEVVIDFEDRHTLFDSLILCRFFRDLYDWERIATIIRGTTGMDLGKEQLQKMALHITNMAREFNLREGMTKADDTLPRRFFEQKLEDSGKVFPRDEFDKLLADYYAIKGWE